MVWGNANTQIHPSHKQHAVFTLTQDMDFFLIHHLKNGLPFNCALSKTCFAQPLKTDWEGEEGGGCHLICRAGLHSSKYSTFPSGFKSNGRKTVCDKHISVAHTDQQTKHTKEQWHTIQWEMLLGFKNENHNYSRHKTTSQNNPH